MADCDDITVVAAVCLQYIVIVSASILLRRKRRRHRQYWVKPWINERAMSVQRGLYHSLFQQLLTTDAQSFQNFMRMDFVAFEEFTRPTFSHLAFIQRALTPFKVGGVAKLSSCHVIGCSHRNTGRYTGVNEQFCNYRPVSLRVGPVQFDTSNFYRLVNRPVNRSPVYRPFYRLVGPLLYFAFSL